MEKISKALSIQTRGEFRELSARAERERLDAEKRKQTPPADHPMWDIWEQIKSYYPGNTGNWDTEPPAIWCAVMIDLTLDQLINGVRNLVHHRDAKGGNDFPPNAGQFKDLCLTSFDWESRCHKVLEPAIMIEDKTAKEKRRLDNSIAMRKMRESIGI